MPPAPDHAPARRRRRRKPWSAKKKNKPKPVQRKGRDLYEVKEIIDETDDEQGRWYLVEWAGTDPRTGGPWPPDWIHQRGLFASECLKKWEVERTRRLYNKVHPRSIRLKRRQPALSYENPSASASLDEGQRDDAGRRIDDNASVFYQECDGLPPDEAVDGNQQPRLETLLDLELDCGDDARSCQGSELMYPPDEEFGIELYQGLLDMDLDADPTLCGGNVPFGMNLDFDVPTPLTPLTYTDEHLAHPTYSAWPSPPDHAAVISTPLYEPLSAGRGASVGVQYPDDTLAMQPALNILRSSPSRGPRTVSELARRRLFVDHVCIDEDEDESADEDSLPPDNSDLPMHLSAMSPHATNMSNTANLDDAAGSCEYYPTGDRGLPAPDFFLHRKGIKSEEGTDDTEGTEALTSPTPATRANEDTSVMLTDQRTGNTRASNATSHAHNVPLTGGESGTEIEQDAVPGLALPSEIRFAERRVGFASSSSTSSRRGFNSIGNTDGDAWDMAPVFTFGVS